MAKSRCDRNVDRGAAQRRNYGQGTKREDTKSEQSSVGERETRGFPSPSRSPAPPFFPAQPRVK